jgi:hypothetical protein
MNTYENINLAKESNRLNYINQTKTPKNSPVIMAINHPNKFDMLHHDNNIINYTGPVFVKYCKYNNSYSYYKNLQELEKSNITKKYIKLNDDELFIFSDNTFDEKTAERFYREEKNIYQSAEIKNMGLLIKIYVSKKNENYLI